MGRRLLQRTYAVPKSLHVATIEAASITDESVSRYGSVAIQLLHFLGAEKINPARSKLQAQNGVLIDLPKRLSPVSTANDSRETLHLSLPITVVDMLEEDANRAGITEKERLVRSLVLRNFVIGHCGAELATFTRLDADPITVESPIHS